MCAQGEDLNTIQQYVSNLGGDRERTAIDALLEVAELLAQRILQDRSADKRMLAGLIARSIADVAAEDGVLDDAVTQSIAVLLSRPVRQIMALIKLLAHRSLDNTQMTARFPLVMRVRAPS